MVIHSPPKATQLGVGDGVGVDVGLGTQQSCVPGQVPVPSIYIPVQRSGEQNCPAILSHV